MKDVHSLMHTLIAVFRNVFNIKSTMNYGLPIDTIDIVQPINQRPTINPLDYIDPEYVTECLIDLEFEFVVGTDKELNVGYVDQGYGMRFINILHGSFDTRARSIEDLSTHNQQLARLWDQLTSAIEKIKLEHPDFKYHIHHDQACYYGTGQRHGTQIFRLDKTGGL